MLFSEVSSKDYMNQESMDYRYEVNVIKLARSMRVPKDLVERFKGGLSRRRIAALKKEAVECPVRGKVVSFLECFFCKNFVRRVRGVVYCKGESL